MLIKSDRFSRIIPTLTGIFLLLFAIYILVKLRGPDLANFVAKKIYPDLRIPYDNEVPQTPKPYLPSSSITAVIGGKGEGISCSIPPWLQGIIFYREDGDDEVALQLRQACAYHDYCYRHGWATYGYSQVDCDFKLQQYSYRLCRQINNKIKSHEQCLSNARTVLLGVRIGGGGPFQDGPKSTFFEFDQIPIGTDDYVISRWINNNSIKQDDLKEDDFLGQFNFYRFKRGNVGIRSIDWNGLDKEGNKKFNRIIPSKDSYFPDQSIPTPPNVFNDGSNDRLVSIARHNQNTTEISIIEYTNFNNNFKLDLLNKEDKNASIFWINNLKKQTIISYWSHYDGLGILPINSSNNTNLTSTLDLKSLKWEPEKPLKKNTYKTLSHVPLTGYFFKHDCPQTIIFNRGAIDDGLNTFQDKNYQQEINLVFSSLSNDKSCILPHKKLTIKAAETDEPIAAFKTDKGHDALLNIKNENNSVILKIFDLNNCNEYESCDAQLLNLAVDNHSLDGSWLRQPIQIISSRTPNDLPLIFFSRIIPTPSNQSDEPSSISIIRYEFAYFHIKSKNDKKNMYFIEMTGLSQCKIDLRKQYMIDINNPLISMIFRVDPNRSNNLQKIKSNPTETLTIIKPFEQYIFSDFYERWANAQIIPGWFIKKNIEPTNSSIPLDVAVIFRGHVGYSFLAKGVRAGKYHGLNNFAPINSYVECETSTQFDNRTDASD